MTALELILSKIPELRKPVYNATQFWTPEANKLVMILVEASS